MKNWNKKDNYNSDIDYKKALRKKKLIKILNICSYVLSLLFIGISVIALCISCNGKKVDKDGNVVDIYESNNVVERYEPKRVIYEDNSYGITFESSDTFDFGLTDSAPYSVSFSLYYYDLSDEQHELQLEFTFFEDNYFEAEGSDDAIVVTFTGEGIEFGLNEDEPFNLADDLVLYFSSFDYSTVKSFFESSIPSQVQYDEELFDAITDTVTNFIGTLSSGIGSVLALFWSNNQLTVLGTLTVIVVGVALVYFLFRFIIGLTRLRG